MTIDRVLTIDGGLLSNGFSALTDLRTTVLPILAIVSLWEFVTIFELVSPLFLPAFHRILLTLFDLIISMEIVDDVYITLERGLLSYVVAVTVSVPLGVLFGWNRTLYRYSEVVIEFLRPLPSVALIPVFFLFFGPSRTTIQMIIFYPVFFLQLIATIYGTQSVNQTLIDAMRTMKIGKFRFYRSVLIPGSLPGIMTGLRQSLATMLILTIVAEMLLANEGLGNFIMMAQRTFRIEEMYGAIMLIGLLGFSLNKLFLIVQGRVLFWIERQTMT